MPDQDFPRCETCDHWMPATNALSEKAMMACLNGDAPTKGMEVPEDFGCILHSSLQDDE